MRGLRPLPYDRRDYDLHRTFGASAAPSFPDALNVDAGLWTPDQNRGGEAFNLPPMPEGCTDYAQTDLCIDEDKALLNPILLEQVTHANALGGVDMRTSLSAALKVFSRTAYFRITPTYPLDFFDAIRLAMLSTQDERRAVSVGTPWFREWSAPLRGGILPVPASFGTTGLGWHNWKVAGWKTIDGAPYLICKMWCGEHYGDEGFAYMSRELANAVLNINGSAAYTLSKVVPGSVQTIDFDFVKWCVSFIRSVFNITAPPGIPEAPATPPVKQSETPPIAPQTPTPTQPTGPTLAAFCEAIKSREGWAPGTRSFKNNNPGNCRYSSVGYAAKYLPVLKDAQGFAIFKDYATGWLYLQNLVRELAKAHPKWTVLDFFKTYAPSTDGNDPVSYAREVAGKIGVDYQTYLVSHLV